MVFVNCYCNEDNTHLSTSKTFYCISLQMGGLECVITGLMDEFSVFFKWKNSREVFTLVVIIMSFSVALINVTPVNMYETLRNRIVMVVLLFTGRNLHVPFVWYVFCRYFFTVLCIIWGNRRVLVLWWLKTFLSHKILILIVFLSCWRFG